MQQAQESWPELYTIRMAYDAIVQGERPWTALGNFMNYWFCYAKEKRTELVQEPIEELAKPTLEQRRWAVFCAASVEYLCQKYQVPCPEWASEQTYTLLEPWFHGLGASKPHVQARLRQESPEPFARRNIFCSERVYANKYETAQTTTLKRQTA